MKLLLVPVIPLLPPIPVAVRLKVPGYEPDIENVTLQEESTPLMKASVFPLPADSVPEDGEIITLLLPPSKLVIVLPPASTARTLISNGVPAVWVPMIPSLVFVTTKLLNAPALTVKLELAGPVVVPSLAVMVVVSAFRKVVARVVVETPFVKLTAVVYDGAEKPALVPGPV